MNDCTNCGHPMRDHYPDRGERRRLAGTPCHHLGLYDVRCRCKSYTDKPKEKQ